MKSQSINNLEIRKIDFIENDDDTLTCVEELMYYTVSNDETEFDLIITPSGKILVDGDMEFFKICLPILNDFIINEYKKYVDNSLATV